MPGNIPSVCYGCTEGKCGMPCNKTAPKIIFPDNYKEILSCGCLAFEYKSHLYNCEFFNENEDQPYFPGCMS